MINKFLHPNGGSETYMFKLGDYLTRCGHEVQYFGMEHPKRCVGNKINAYVSNMDFHSQSAIKKISYSLKTIYSIEARRKIRLVLEFFQPDVCHLNNFNYQLTPSIILEIEKWKRQTHRNCKVVFTAHDYNIVCPNHMLRNPNIQENCEKCLGGDFVNCFYGRCIHGSRLKSLIGTLEGYFWKMNGVYKHIDKVICCSGFLQKKINNNSTLASKTVVMHNFVDSMEWKEVTKDDYVLYFGRYSEEKGIQTFIDVCKELQEIPFVFAGTGPLEKTIESVKNIKNVGFKTGTELEEMIRKARFSVYPSEWYENCPFSVMESQICGTPVLGADIGGIPELIDDGVTGELFQSGNANELRCKIEKLWYNKELTKQYEINCKEIKFDSIKDYVKKLLDIYEG